MTPKKPTARPLKGSCWCSKAWKSTSPRNHQDHCVAIWNRKQRAADQAEKATS